MSSSAGFHCSTLMYANTRLLSSVAVAYMKIFPKRNTFSSHLINTSHLIHLVLQIPQFFVSIAPAPPLSSATRAGNSNSNTECCCVNADTNEDEILASMSALGLYYLIFWSGAFAKSC